MYFTENNHTEMGGGGGGVKLREKRRVRVEFIVLVKTSREKLHFKLTFKLHFFPSTLQLVISPSFVCWEGIFQILSIANKIFIEFFQA